jgi:hypothetical protein
VRAGAAAALTLITAVALIATAPTFTFDDSPLGAPPAGFFFAGSRQATPGVWEVRGAAKDRYLVHLADPAVTMRGISVAPISAAAPANVKIATRLRLVDGDRAGGVVWRYRDANNFYFMALVFADRNPGAPAERYASLFRVTGGNRIRLDLTPNIDLDPSAWHTVTVVHEGDQIRASINGVGILNARDAMIAEGGHAGVWSAGNSTSWFDDVSLSESPE